MTNTNWIDNELHYIFLLKYNGDFADLHMQKSEIDELKFISAERLEKDILDEKKYALYVPRAKDYYLRIVKEVKKRTGK